MIYSPWVRWPTASKGEQLSSGHRGRCPTRACCHGWRPSLLLERRPTYLWVGVVLVGIIVAIAVVAFAVVAVLPSPCARYRFPGRLCAASARCRFPGRLCAATARCRFVPCVLFMFLVLVTSGAEAPTE